MALRIQIALAIALCMGVTSARAVADSGSSPAAEGSSASETAQTQSPSAPENAQNASDSSSGSSGQSSGSSDAPAAPSARPWADGVSLENQKQALKIFREGNALLKDSVFGQAAIKYREALEYWDHPAIHYNMVLALFNMDRPTEVLEHLEKAMAYGPDPIDPEKFEQAKNYRRLTESQLSHLTVRCEMEGAVISMDGQELFVGPGQYQGFVRPGPHSIVAKKEGYMNSEVSPALVAGGKAEYDMVLMTANEATAYKRRWAVWKPWSVFAGGVVLAGIGVALHVSGRNSVSSYDDAVNKIKVGESGEENIVYESDIKSKRDAGLRNQKIAMAMYGVGGAAIVAGSVLLYLNRSRPYNPDTGEYLDVKKKDETESPAAGETPKAPEEEKKVEVSVLPMISPETAGVMATFNF